TPSNSEWVLATANYGEPYVAAVRKGNVQAVQFHPEKSGSECRLLVASREGEVGIQEVSELYVAAVRKGSVCSAGHAIPPGEIRSGQRRLVIQGARPASHATIQTPFPSPLLSFPSLPAPLLFPHFSRLSPRLSPLPPLLSPSSPPFLSNPMPVVGLDILRRFLGPNRSQQANEVEDACSKPLRGPRATQLAKRVIACLDVRANDRGDLVVTKGDQYDVQEQGDKREVRNLGMPVELAARYFREGRTSPAPCIPLLPHSRTPNPPLLRCPIPPGAQPGKPVELAARYFKEGADEVAFLNITGFRDFSLGDLPMLEHHGLPFVSARRPAHARGHC
ncbi:unnamed protein product, partial [Closterium sp. NIES-54]